MNRSGTGIFFNKWPRRPPKTNYIINVIIYAWFDSGVCAKAGNIRYVIQHPLFMLRVNQSRGMAMFRLDFM